jgi:choline monooxygenase
MADAQEEDAAMRTLPEIHPEIAQASTLPAWAYRDAELFETLRERVFASSWQLAGDLDQARVPGQVQPFTLLEGCLDEPLLWARDTKDQLRCLSNVCTHRGTLVCEGAGVEHVLRCRYHGRRFGVDGKFLSMPEFGGVSDFPSTKDDLAPVPFERWGKFLFTSLRPGIPFERWIAPVAERCGFLPIDSMAFDATRSRDYLVRANWALYCDNYLEGFHIPYVHAGLAAALDYDAYRTELFEHCNLQVGVAADGEECLDLPPTSPDFGQRIVGYYFWLFPNLMLNVYPWGISVNIVQPLAVDRTKVRFLTYVWDPSRLDRGAGTSLDRVEREDESVVEAVQRGVRSRFYERGRYSPKRETGVHHFHRLLSAALT